MAGSNQFLTTDLITNEILAEFVNAHPYLATAQRRFQGDFTDQTYQYGNTINVRRQNFFTVGDGRISTPQPVLETSEPLTLNHQYNVSISYNSQDLTLKMADFSRRYIQPAIRQIIGRSELDIARQAITDLYFATGTPGSPINSFGVVERTAAFMRQLAMPVDQAAYLVLSESNASELKIALQNNFNTILNSEISLRSQLGRLSIFDIFGSQAIPTQTAGTFAASGSVTLLSTVTSGNQLTLTGFTASSTGVLLAGDQITVAGSYSINPVNYQPTMNLITFEVVSDATGNPIISSDGSGHATIIVNPSIISDTSNPLRNVSAPLASGAIVTHLSSYVCNVAYADGGLDIAMPPLDALDLPYSKIITDEDANVSLRVSKQGDIINDVNILRIDVLAGYKWHPQYAVKLVS